MIKYKVIGRVTPIREEAEQYAKGFRWALRREGKPYVGFVKILRTPKGFAATYCYKGGKFVKWIRKPRL